MSVFVCDALVFNHASLGMGQIRIRIRIQTSWIRIRIQDKRGGFGFGFKPKGVDSDSRCPDSHITDGHTDTRLLNR